ncbi:hypothetical protein ACIP25_11450 [Streptomyces massasporeus]|uniref:hypothetical protein n=1 Tax=Streptomyces massasporeus TaxID=67324 RepID=UPI00382D4F8E
MTLDAMHWVWNHSQSKGNARIALLYVADQVRDPACEVRIGQRELLVALNTRSKDTVEKAIKTAVELGELEVAAPAAGRRPVLYRMPKAIGYLRPATACAPESGAQSDTPADRCAPKTGAQSSASAPDSGAQTPEPESRSAPKTGAQATRCAPKTGAPPQHYEVEEEGQRPRRDAFAICQPLIKALTEAGITVSWGMPPDDLIRVADAVERAGITAMVRFAVDTQRTRRDRILYARYFVRGWTGLPPAASGPAPHRDGKPPHCGHPDCDPASRLRETEDDNGLRRVHPCPDCHPNAQKGHAA